MKAVFERDALGKALSRLAGIVPRRLTMPILAHAKLSLFENTAELRVSNLDCEASEVLGVEREDSGETVMITLPALMLRDIVKRLPAGGQLSLEVIDDVAVITSGRGRHKLPTLPVGEFPEMANALPKDGWSVPAGAFKSLIEGVVYAVSTDEHRYYLRGVYLCESPAITGLRAVATDRHRLALRDLPLEHVPEDLPASILPAWVVADLARWIDEAGNLFIRAGASAWEFRRGDGAVLITKLIYGDFPDYTSAIPEPTNKPLRVDREALLAAAERVGVVCDKENLAIAVSAKPDSLELSARGDHGAQTGEEQVPANYGGPEEKIGLNLRYLRDLLGRFAAGEVVLHPNGASGPVLFEGTEADGTAVIMPMRV